MNVLDCTIRDGGYVNNWNTKDYSKFILKMKKKYKNSKVKVCRDHCGPGFNGNYSEALGSIKADVLYMPSETDMYFHIDALTREANMIPVVKIRIITLLTS